jgi:PAS domain S-box-containing protein
MPLPLPNRSAGELSRFEASQVRGDDPELYFDLAKHAPVGLMVLEPPEGEGRTFKILSANHAAIAISALKELDAADVHGKEINELFPSICEHDLEQSLSNVLRSGCPCHLGQVQQGDADLVENAFSIQAFPLPNNHLGLAIESISERKRSEAALRIVQTGFLEILDTVPDAVLLCDPEGRILFVNRQAEQLFGYKRVQLFQQPVEQLFPERLRQEQLFPWIPHPAESQRHSVAMRVELFWRREDGTEFPAEVTLSETNVEGNLVVCAAIRDTTERKRGEEAVRRAVEEMTRSNAELEQFAHAASHDLQEPLRTVISVAQLFGMDYSEQLDEQAKRYLSMVVESSKRMQSLLNGLLQYARSGAQQKPFEIVNCGEVCDAAAADLKAAFEQSGAVLTREHLPSVKGDRVQLIQLFQNLLANAIKFRRQLPPRIHVSCERRDQQWVFAVRDNGIGIPHEKFEKIFHLFSRLHGLEHYPGTGIGLAVCRKIVTQHGGRIWVESQPGEGSVFYFSFPAEDSGSRT